MLFHQKNDGQTYLVVGLGNPGDAYQGTRHNVGFMVIDRYAAQKGVAFKASKRQALWCQTTVGTKKVILIKPQTYMNLSGDAVGAFARFYRVPPEQVIVLSDDVSLPVGKLRIRPKGSAGGHNGLKDIIAKLPGETFARVRLGVGEKPHPDYDLADWVLGKVPKEQLPELEEAMERAVKAVDEIILHGCADAMNRYNR